MGQPNERLDFVEQPNRVSVEAMYEDDNHSLWRILAVGESEIVEEFVAQRDLIINLEPISDEEVIEYPPPSEPPENLNEPMDTSSRETYQEQESSLLPGLAVRLELLRSAITRGPRRIHFELDPPIGPAGTPSGKRSYDFYAGYNDGAADVGYSTGVVTVTVSLEGENRASSSGSSGTVSAAGKGKWTVCVTNNTANSGTFRLTNDIYIP
jgi:hypothetical protein